MKMKRTALFVTLLLLAGTAFAQTGAFNVAVGSNYRVFSEVSAEHAQTTVKKLDALFDLYNTYFHFNPSTLSTKLRVRIFSDKDNFDSYLSTLITDGRESFVYLQYRDLEKSELLGFADGESEDYDTALAHYGFVQFLKAFIPNPPLWLQKGFAVYLEKSTYDATADVALYQANLGWVRYLKDFVNQQSDGGFIPLPLLLDISVDAANSQIEDFYAESWGLISFLLESEDKRYNRIAWDAISALSPDATKEENEAAIASEAFRWITVDQAYGDFQDYINTVKTFPDLVRDGMALYSAGDLSEAEKSFTKAIEKNSTHDIPYYYMGLISYGREDFSLAEYYYKTSLQMGADAGLAYYALGVNAFADDRLTDARTFLSSAVDSDPTSYSEKASELIERIEKKES